MEEVGTIQWNQKHIKIHHHNHPDLEAIQEDNPSTYRIINPIEGLITEVKRGLKILHSIVIKNHYYFVKASFLKLHYQLFDGREFIGELKVMRKDKKRWFKITLNEDNDAYLFSLYVLAQSVRKRTKAA